MMSAVQPPVKRRYNASKRRQAAERTRAAILDAARALFIERGYTATAMTAIAERAGVGFAPPLHRHLEEDEMFYLLSGSAEFRCDGQAFQAGPGDFVLLPVGLAHTFLVGSQEPLRVLQITTPSGFEDFAAAAGEPARERRLPDPGPVDPAALGHAAAQHAIELLGPPPQH